MTTTAIRAVLLEADQRLIAIGRQIRQEEQHLVEKGEVQEARTHDRAALIVEQAHRDLRGLLAGYR